MIEMGERMGGFGQMRRGADTVFGHEFCCEVLEGGGAFKAGDVNTVIQRSTDGGRTWGPIIPVSPGFPRGGGYSAPVLVEPDGRVLFLYPRLFVVAAKSGSD